MIPTQTNIYENFENFIIAHFDSHIGIQGNFGTNNSEFLEHISKNSFFEDKNILFVNELSKKKILSKLNKNEGKSFDYIIFETEIFDFYELKNLLEKYNIIGKIIFLTLTDFSDSDVDIFEIPEISFREYSESSDEKITIQEILKGTADISNIETLAHKYLESGSFVKNIENPDAIMEDFKRKRAIINEELFEKEKIDFENFIGTLAVNISSLFKEDYIAKSMNISRRKVKKYTELLLKHDIIRSVKPFFEDSEKELSRHDKFYFSDLSFYRGAMGNAYGLGNSKISVMENFIFLELSRKLKDTHDIFFWRKKSGTNIAFILKNRENNKLTPIEVGFSSPKNISQTMKSFYDSYGERVEYGMFLNEGKIFSSTFGGKSFLTLPFYTI